MPLKMYDKYKPISITSIMQFVCSFVIVNVVMYDFVSSYIVNKHAIHVQFNEFNTMQYNTISLRLILFIY